MDRERRPSGGARIANCNFRPLLGGKPAEKRKIRSVFEALPEHIGGQAMMHGAKPVRVAKRNPLIV